MKPVSRFQITTETLSSLSLPVSGVSHLEPCVLTSIDGLGPPGQQVSLASTLYFGDVFQGTQPISREIVITVKINPDYSQNKAPADYRPDIYKMFNAGPDSSVRFSIFDFDDVEMARVYGYVKSIVPTLDSSESDFQMIIACPSAYFDAPQLTEIDVAVANANKGELSLPNLGDVPVGFEFAFTKAPTPNFIFGLNRYMGWDEKLHFFKTTNAIVPSYCWGDTRPGSRYFYQLVGEDTYNKLGDLVAGSEWPMLYPGDNVFTVNQPGPFNWNYIRYRIRYWGV